MIGQDQMRRILAPLQRRIALIAARVIVRLSDDDKKIQELQVEALSGEVQDGVQHLQPYGYSSRPFAEAEGFAIYPNGTRGRGVVIVVADRRYRLKSMEEGEVAIFTDEGDRVHLKRNGQIEILAGSQVTIKSPVTRLEGSLEVTGEVKDRCDSDGHTMEEQRTVFDQHRHISHGKGNLTNLPIPPIG